MVFKPPGKTIGPNPERNEDRSLTRERSKYPTAMAKEGIARTIVEGPDADECDDGMVRGLLYEAEKALLVQTIGSLHDATSYG
jgi:hypothetical protein